MGVILYTLLMGEQPFKGPTPEAQLESLLTLSYAAPTDLSPGLLSNVESQWF